MKASGGCSWLGLRPGPFEVCKGQGGRPDKFDLGKKKTVSPPGTESCCCKVFVLCFPQRYSCKILSTQPGNTFTAIQGMRNHGRILFLKVQFRWHDIEEVHSPNKYFPKVAQVGKYTFSKVLFSMVRHKREKETEDKPKNDWNLAKHERS